MQYNTSQYTAGYVNGVGVSTGIISYTNPSLANGMLIVCITGSSAEILSNVKWNGVSMTFVSGDTDTLAGTQIWMYYLLNPSSGVNNFNWTSNFTNLIYDVVISSYANVQQSAQPNTSTDSNSTAQPYSLITTTTSKQCTVIFWGSQGSGNLSGVNTNITSRQGDNKNLFGDSGGYVPIGAYTQTMGITAGRAQGCTAAFIPDALIYIGSMFLVFE